MTATDRPELVRPLPPGHDLKALRQAIADMVSGAATRTYHPLPPLPPVRDCPACPAPKGDHDEYGCIYTGCQVPHWRLVTTTRAMTGAQLAEREWARAQAALDGDAGTAIYDRMREQDEHDRRHEQRVAAEDEARDQ